MAANLVRRYEPADAHHLLNLSLAQFQADQAVVRMEARIERMRERLGSAKSPTARQRSEQELARLQREVRSRTESLARRFDRVLRLLETWGYLDGWALTDRGGVLARTYHECDLLVAEAMCSGLLDGLDPAALAGLASTFTYEHRGPTPSPPPSFPSQLIRRRWEQIRTLSAEMASDEQAAGLPTTRSPDAGFLERAHGWAAGEPLAEVLDHEDISGGDFVRNIKTLMDLLRQIGEVAPNPVTAQRARQATEGLHRGVVAASSALDDAADVEALVRTSARELGQSEP
jgi:ATP-dependent RNA helicase HelY